MPKLRSARRGARYIGLTGVPGTGKSSSAALLPRRIEHLEIEELAQRELGAVPEGGNVVVDLERLGRWLTDHPPQGRPTVIVGHLAHLLPIASVILLRCHPRELSRRLQRGRAMSLNERRDNVWAEATDVILFEARRRNLRIWEVDTTRRTPAQVARRILDLVDRPPPTTKQFVDWLDEPTVTEHLLDP
ncbi:MAG: AAA family ATPase [Thermoplasmata archaeon]|nr:AAA family ATPase [Thermoplasmata archaeon]